MSDIKKEVLSICTKAKEMKLFAAALTNDKKNEILLEAANLMDQKRGEIVKANEIDVKLARNKGLEAAKIDRLILGEDRIDSMIKAIKEISSMPDPVGRILYQNKMPSGIEVIRKSFPIGVLLAIYESRPNVTSDVAALSIKSGNVAILRCGSDSINSSKIISEIYRQSFVDKGYESASILLVPHFEREYVAELLKMEKYIDVVIPRGGKSLIEAVRDNTRIPLFLHLDGNCHTYINEDADRNKAIKILINAKMRRVGICGATESLIIDKKIAISLLPIIVDHLGELGCQVRGDEVSTSIDSRILAANEQDFYQEYLDKIISIKVVDNIDQAIEHINKYGSSHTESIITENSKYAEKFFTSIDSAILMQNTSTQFADGGEFGMGAEIGISTGKLHARGPVGLEQLTTYKYIVKSDCGLRK